MTLLVDQLSIYMVLLMVLWLSYLLVHEEDSWFFRPRWYEIGMLYWRAAWSHEYPHDKS